MQGSSVRSKEFEPHIRHSSPGNQHCVRSAPIVSGFETQQGLVPESRRVAGNWDFTLKGLMHKLTHSETQNRGSSLKYMALQPTCMLQHTPRQHPLQLQPLSQDDPSKPSMTWDTTSQVVSTHLHLYCQGGPSLACPRTPLGYSYSRPCLLAKPPAITVYEVPRWRRSRWTWGASLSMDTPGTHLQTQKCMQNTCWEQTGVPDQRKRIYRIMRNSIGGRN